MSLTPPDPLAWLAELAGPPGQEERPATPGPSPPANAPSQAVARDQSQFPQFPQVPEIRGNLKPSKDAGSPGSPSSPAQKAMSEIETGAAGAAGKASFSAAEPIRPACRDCRHFRRPGLSDGYCGGDRPDLPPAYGPGHPLRRLPDDGGEGCPTWAGRWPAGPS